MDTKGNGFNPRNPVDWCALIVLAFIIGCVMTVLGLGIVKLAQVAL